MKKWDTSNTADLIAAGTLEIGDGYRAKNAEFATGGGLPFVRVADVGHRTVRLHGIDELPMRFRQKYEPKVSRSGDSLITMKGTVGRVAFVDKGAPAFVYSPQISYWRSKDSNRVDPRWLSYWLEGDEFAWQALATKGATDMADYINLRDQRRMMITLPPVAEQSAIAAVLSAIDDLLENNRRRVVLLAEMAGAIYREWFVRFRYPGHTGTPLVDSPLGPIPVGWTVEPLFDVADVGFGFSFKSSRFGEVGRYPVVRIRDVSSGTTETFSNEEPGERYRVIDGDVLIGMDGEFHLRQWTGGEAWLNQRVARLRPRRNFTSLHLMLALRDPIRYWNDAISGTTVAHLGKRHLEQIRLLRPRDDVVELAGPLFDDVSRQVCVLVQASRQLARCRDLLLPKLVSGAIDVSSLDVETFAS